MPKIVDHEAYRKELLGKCFDLFAEKGYTALTMRQIAAGLNVSTGTIYHYFPNKESLFEQMVREISQRDFQQVMTELKQYDSVLERIEASFRFFAEYQEYFIKQNLIWVEFYQQQKRETGGKIKVFHEIWKEREQEVSEIVGIFDPQLLRFLGCAIDGMLLRRMFDEDNFSFEEHSHVLLQMLKCYLERNECLGES